MEKSTARELIGEYLRYETILGRITELSHKIEDAETQNSVRRAACDAQCYLYEGLVRPILKEYPALAPHGSDGGVAGEGPADGKSPEA